MLQQQRLQDIESRQMSEGEALKAENERLRKEIGGYLVEEKQAQSTIAELQEKYEEKALAPKRFMIWNWELIVLWICKIENGKYDNLYRKILTESLSQHDVKGADLLDVNPFILKMWGIMDQPDRNSINDQIRNLVQNDKHQKPQSAAPMQIAPEPQENEGDETPMI